MYKEVRDYTSRTTTRYSLLTGLPTQIFPQLPEHRAVEEKVKISPRSIIGSPPIVFFSFQKVDENGNALNQNSSETKKNKKEKRDKNVVLINSQDVVGHRSDIIDDLDKLVEFIDGNEEQQQQQQSGAKSKSNLHKSKLHKHVSTEEKPVNKKQRTRSKAKNGDMQKSTSMEEISTTKLEDFNFSKDSDSKVPLRPTKSNADRPRERRSWGNSEVSRRRSELRGELEKFILIYFSYRRICAPFCVRK